MTVTGTQGVPSLVAAARQLGLEAVHLDHEFGVVAVDPAQGLYAVRVKRAATDKTGRGDTDGYAGPWSDPAIKPFGSK
jgi:hypothetical protein